MGEACAAPGPALEERYLGCLELCRKHRNEDLHAEGARPDAFRSSAQEHPYSDGDYLRRHCCRFSFPPAQLFLSCADSSCRLPLPLEDHRLQGEGEATG